MKKIVEQTIEGHAKEYFKCVVHVDNRKDIRFDFAQGAAAMEPYIGRVAIAFAEWVDKEGYRQDRTSVWSHKLTYVSIAQHSTSQLFSWFQNTEEYESIFKIQSQ